MGFLNDDGVLYFWSIIKEYVSKNKVSKTSELQNDSGYITAEQVPDKIVVDTDASNLSNDASHVPSSSVLSAAKRASELKFADIDTSIANINDTISGLNSIDISVVESYDKLPQTGKTGVIYLVPHEHESKDVYDEYLWTGSKYEKIGNTDVDLTGYLKTSDMQPISNDTIKSICV